MTAVYRESLSLLSWVLTGGELVGLPAGHVVASTAVSMMFVTAFGRVMSER